jgi:polyhydroxybutyrate depolymerase
VNDESGSESTGDGDGDGDGDGEVEPNCAGDLEAGDFNRDVMVDGVERKYRLFVPSGYDPAVPTPMVVNYHGFGSNAGQQVFFSNMNEHAEEQGYLVAYPEGLQNSDGSQAHDGGPFCCADDDGRDDLAFLAALIDATKTEACLDPRRVFGTGMSNGGYMSYRLACDASELIAAVAPVTGSLGLMAADCTPERPVPLIAFNGTADQRVPIGPATQSVEFYANLLGCDDEPAQEEVFGSVTCETFQGCADQSEVVFCSAEGMGHCWPGTEFCVDPPSTLDISANHMMWEFFEAHPMPE